MVSKGRILQRKRQAAGRAGGPDFISSSSSIILAVWVLALAAAIGPACSCASAFQQPSCFWASRAARRTSVADTNASFHDHAESQTLMRMKKQDDDLFFLASNLQKKKNDKKKKEEEVVDVAIIGAGLGGLCAGAILNTLYGKTVGIYESHYLAGGCAHAFPRQAADGTTFLMDSGPTILLGCSQPPLNALQQILQAVNQTVDWISYDGWGMIEHPGKAERERRWKVQLGPDHFEQGPLLEFGGDIALREYTALRELTQPLLAGVDIPAMAMRSGASALIPLAFRHWGTLVQLMQQGNATTGTFAPYMDGPAFTVTSPWLRDWLDALAFSLSGLPANRTAAAAMAFTLADMHKPQAALDYPAGGMGSIVDALVRGVEQGPHGSRVHLAHKVQRIDFSRNEAVGVTLARSGKKVRARDGVICNAPVWSLRGLVEHDDAALRVLLQNQQLPLAAAPPRRRSSWTMLNDGERAETVAVGEPAATATLRKSRPPEWDFTLQSNNANGETMDEEEASKAQRRPSVLEQCELAEQTGSFLHLHLALNARGLDLSQMEAHYTVMDRGLSGNPDFCAGDGPCGELNMIAVSNPCVIDPTLAPPNTLVVHAYGAGNEPYDLWQGMNRRSPEYQALKEERCQVLWRAVESIIPDVRERVLLDLTGSPLTHERFLRRPRGTYGSATEDYLKDGATPISKLVLAGDGIFPGIGVPAVALSGASAANSLVNPWEHWQILERLAEVEKKNKLRLDKQLQEQ